ncbi:MAG: redoxin domain-containing protein [Planctomycetes bacterium]|nr:redoxin domain-containing protein [Planctomycetota bacterium]MBI3833605.1 redoxin domain-containing protein [Planctomycetota bacterium]
MNSPDGPVFDPTFAWLNTDRALHFDGELKGQVVVLDFWTYCCINCIHILPDLSYLEKKYASEPVTFIGVHSAKFSNEANRETIRAAILRYEIHHPVIVDENMKLWRAFRVRSWPTVVVIGPTGAIVTAFAGEGNRDALDEAIGQALAQGRSLGTLAAGPLKLRREGNVRGASGLAFPGKVLADAATKRLFIADSNHYRIVIAEFPDADGRAKVVNVIGSGACGADDAPADRATFNHPQGLALGRDNLYVADTENHLIRRIELRSGDVRTVVGTGKMTYDFSGGGMGVDQGINSPWDLVLEGSTLYVAMAGQHQIWRVDLPVGFARALAGTGRENIVDGPTETSAFSQPSGICALDGKLYVADSEVSAIRCIDMATERVTTILGEGLFSFGDVDGVFPQAKLQHPLGVAGWGKLVLVADTYNHKIKAIDPATRAARTLYGTGKPGASTADGGVEFFEPGGLSVAGDFVFVADTNNHRIVRVNLKTHQWHEIILEGLARPRFAHHGAMMEHVATGAIASIDADGIAANDLEDASPDWIIDVEPVAVTAQGEVTVSIDPFIPRDAHLSADAPWSIRVSNGQSTIAQHTGKSDRLPLSIRIPANSLHPPQEITVSANLAYCTAGVASVCVPRFITFRVPLKPGAQTKIDLKEPLA